MKTKVADTLLQLVADFHANMGLPVATTPRQLQRDRLAARANWLREEVSELAASDSLVKQVDATLDIIYLALGNLVEMGVPLDPAFDAVHRANLAKRWPDGSLHTDDEGKILKPPGWLGPERELLELIQQSEPPTATGAGSSLPHPSLDP